MDGAGAKGRRGAYELKSNGKYRDECIPGLARFQLCLALRLCNIKYLQLFGESHMRDFYTIR